MVGFSKSQRLRKREEFSDTLDNGIKIVVPEFVVVGRLRPDLTDARLGLVVSRKVGNSVIRNRVKRQLREGFRHLKLGCSDVVPADIVVIARARAGELAVNEENEALRRAFLYAAKKLRTRMLPQRPCPPAALVDNGGNEK